MALKTVKDPLPDQFRGAVVIAYEYSYDRLILNVGKDQLLSITTNQFDISFAAISSHIVASNCESCTSYSSKGIFQIDRDAVYGALIGSTIRKSWSQGPNNILYVSGNKDLSFNSMKVLGTEEYHLYPCYL